MTCYFWRFVHNAIIHPLIGIFGEARWIMFLHDWTAKKWRKIKMPRDLLEESRHRGRMLVLEAEAKERERRLENSNNNQHKETEQERLIRTSVCHSDGMPMMYSEAWFDLERRMNRDCDD